MQRNFNCVIEGRLSVLLLFMFFSEMKGVGSSTALVEKKNIYLDLGLGDKGTYPSYGKPPME